MIASQLPHSYLHSPILLRNDGSGGMGSEAGAIVLREEPTPLRRIACAHPSRGGEIV